MQYLNHLLVLSIFLFLLYFILWLICYLETVLNFQMYHYFNLYVN